MKALAAACGNAHDGQGQLDQDRQPDGQPALGWFLVAFQYCVGQVGNVFFSAPCFAFRIELGLEALNVAPLTVNGIGQKPDAIPATTLEARQSNRVLPDPLALASGTD